MEEIKKTPQYNIISAILFALAALIAIVGIFSHIKYIAAAFLIDTLFSVIGYILLAVALFANKRDKLVLVGFALLAVAPLIQFFYRFRNFLPNLVSLVGYLGALAVVVILLTDYLPQYKEYAKKLWFVPAACIAGRLIIDFFAWLLHLITGGPSYSVGFWETIICAAAVLFAIMWIVYPDGLPKTQYAANSDGSVSASSVSQSDGHFDLAAHVLLLLFTFGIWYYVWNYRTTKYLNCVQDEPPRNPTTKLLLCMFVPFYSIYWVYKSAQRIDKLAKINGIQSDLSTLCLILAIFIGIIPPILMQEKINAIAKQGANTTAENHRPEAEPVVAPQADAEPAPAAPKAVVDVPEELKKYKELLDSGIITQEEFDQKKKQLLDL